MVRLLHAISSTRFYLTGPLVNALFRLNFVYQALSPRKESRMFRKASRLFCSLLVLAGFASAQATRHFTFHYAFTVKDIPAGANLRVWIPAAQTDAFQEVKIVSATGDASLKQTHESRYRN